MINKFWMAVVNKQAWKSFSNYDLPISIFFKPIYPSRSKSFRVSLNRFELIQSDLSLSESIWVSLNRFKLIQDDLSQFESIWINSSWFKPIWVDLRQSESIWSESIQAYYDELSTMSSSLSSSPKSEKPDLGGPFYQWSGWGCDLWTPISYFSNKVTMNGLYIVSK